MDKEKINQMFVVVVIMTLLILVIAFIISTLVTSKTEDENKLQVKYNQIYSSDYTLRAIDSNYFIGSYEENRISVIINNEGHEVYKNTNNIYYEGIYKTKHDEYIIYNNLDNKLNVYLFDGKEIRTLYELDNVSYVKPVIYKNLSQEYIRCFVSMIDDDLYIYNLDEIEMNVINDASLVGDQIIDGIYYINNENNLVVRNKDGLMGVVDLKGETIIDYKYENIVNTSNNSFIISQDGKYGIINDKEEKLIKTNYKAIYDFNDYFVIVNSKNKMALYNSDYDNLTGFKMNYDSLIPFNLRSSVRSVSLYKVNGKVVVVNNYLEDVNKTEYDNHDFYVINDKEIQKTIEEVGFGCESVVYTYDSNYELSIYDNYFEIIIEYKINDAEKINNVLLVANNLYQIIYEDVNGQVKTVYINDQGEEEDINLGENIFYNNIYSEFKDKNDNGWKLTMYDQNLNILDTLEGLYIYKIDEYVIVDNSIYKIVVM